MKADTPRPSLRTRVQDILSQFWIGGTAEAPPSDEKIETITGLAFSERDIALTETSRRLGRSLLILGAVGLLVGIFEITIKDVSVSGIGLPGEHTGMLKFSLFVVLLYQLLMFIWHASPEMGEAILKIRGARVQFHENGLGELPSSNFAVSVFETIWRNLRNIVAPVYGESRATLKSDTEDRLYTTITLMQASMVRIFWMEFLPPILVASLACLTVTRAVSLSWVKTWVDVVFGP